jgi:hypothetical protein
MMIDLEEPWAKQSDVLALVPGLNQGMLQNWIARKIFDIENPMPEKKGRLRWPTVAILAMRFMMEVRKYGMEPHLSVRLADDFVQGVGDFMQRFKTTVNAETGVEEYTFDGDREYRRMEIMVDKNGELFIVPEETNPQLRNMFNAILYHSLTAIRVESDIMFMTGLNAVARYRAGRDPQTGKTERSKG